ncbi:MAG: IPT/TIG domain-containing protein [Planctomycetes bacterium]|nr:IPT/TIG domain-containing protein [Planctomycetota bacterium]MBI3844961.1 IPT/TIG domain-containing protein [Planctomycetota bacterium]
MSILHVVPLLALVAPVETAPDMALRFVESHASLFRARSTELRLDYSARAANRTYVVFEQALRGVPVLGSQVVFRVLANDCIQAFDERGTIANLDIDLAPHVSCADAEDAFLDRLLEDGSIEDSTTFRFDDPTLAIRPDGSGSRLVWRVRVSTSDPLGAWIGIVDARSGETLDSTSDLYSTDVSGSVDARALVSNSCFGDPLDVAELRHLNVRVANAGASFTDETGAFTIANVDSSPVLLVANLTGRWIVVSDATNRNLSWSGSVTPGNPVAIHFLASGGSEIELAQTNAYVHGNGVHDFVKAHATVAGIDRAIPCTVNVASTCNAFYSHGSITCFHSGGGCSNSASASVIAHEYGHFLDDVTGGIADAALTEGNGDILSLLYTADACEWRCMRPGDGASCARDNSAGRIWPANECHGEPHCIGQTWAGFAWDARANLIAALGDVEGSRVAADLFLATFLANPPSIPDAVRETFLADDDDGALGNGTPHGALLADAASRHGFTAPLPPAIVALRPNEGRPCGGEAIEVFGSAFQRNATVVRFGGVPATVVSISSNGATAIVRPPARPAGGPVAVSVVTPYGSTSIANGYDYRFAADATIREGGLALGRTATLDVAGEPDADFVVIAGFDDAGAVFDGVSLAPGPARVIADSIVGTDPRASACGSFSKTFVVPARPSLALRHVFLQGAVRVGGVLQRTTLRTFTIVP